MFLMEMFYLLGLLIVCCIIVNGRDIDFTSVYLDARCLATCLTEVIV